MSDSNATRHAIVICSNSHAFQSHPTMFLFYTFVFVFGNTLLYRNNEIKIQPYKTS